MATERDSRRSGHILKKRHSSSSSQNYLAKWLELSRSLETLLDALVYLIVKEQFINACSEELAMYLLEGGPKDLVELTTWALNIAHKQQLGDKSKNHGQAQTCRTKEMDRVQTRCITSTPEVATVLPLPMLWTKRSKELDTCKSE